MGGLEQHWWALEWVRLVLEEVVVDVTQHGEEMGIFERAKERLGWVTEMVDLRSLFLMS